MKGLLIKDFKLLKIQRYVFMLFFIEGILISFSSYDTTFLIGFFSIVVSRFAASSISYDEMDNGNAFLFSLPISRRDYVVEKYVFGIFLGIMAWTASLLIISVIEGIQGILPSADTLLSSFMMLMVVFVFLALILPFQLKFGTEKGRVIFIACILLAFSFAAAIVSESDALSSRLTACLRFLPTMNDGILAVIALVVTALLLFLSGRISLSIVRQKEF